MGTVAGVPGASEGRPRVGASAEVLAYHAAQHGRTCRGPAGCRLRHCPCGRCVVICCGCGEPLYLAVAPGPTCLHAAEVWAA